MGTCVSRQTRPDGKPEEDREQPETYSNSTSYFISQLIALITHETYTISPDVIETLLLTHIFYSDRITLLIAIRERFFLTYQRYKFTTYKRECDITVTYNPHSKTRKSVHSNRPMKRLPIPQTPTSHSLSTSAKHTPSPSPQTPNLNTISDELDTKEFEDTNAGFPTVVYRHTPKNSQRLRAGTIEIGYIPSKVLEFEQWIIEVKIVIQRKCLDLLLKWIENYWIEDFENSEKRDTEMMDILKQFISDIKKSRDQFQNLHKTKKNKKVANSGRYHKMYAAFIQSYVLKLENIIATQQTWYKPILKQLRNKQESATQLYNEQIKNSKKFRNNRLNSTINKHQRSSTNSVSAFSDNIFGDNLLQISDDDCEESQHNLSPKACVSNNKRNSKSVSYSATKALLPMGNGHSENVSVSAGLGNTLSFIAMKNQENAKEYAKQLTLLDWELFIDIEPRNCLYKILKKKESERWLSVKLFIDRFQQTHQYVIVSIIAAPDLKYRIEMLEFFIFVAESLLKLNNLYSFMAVVTALDSVSISKLKITWEYVNKSCKRKLKEYLSPLCGPSNNYKALRDYSKTMRAPSIPFLGLILKDLTFTNDGNKGKLAKNLDKHINFHKYELFSKIISANVMRHKSKSYCAQMKHSKQFETQDINSIVKDLDLFSLDCDGKEEETLEDAREINIIPDLDLQNNILKDLNSYILLGKNLIRAMTVEANRIDNLTKDKYASEYLNRNAKRKSEGTNGKKSKLFKTLFGTSKSSKKEEKNSHSNNMTVVKE